MKVDQGGFEEEAPFPADREDAFLVSLDAFEGPLDLLLDLARREKVDLGRISIANLATQYLRFIEEATRLRLELAADYLVMAAWLTYLKSRLLLPDAPRDDGPSGEEMAAALAHRLRRLEAMRRMADELSGRNQLGRDTFPRGAPEGVRMLRKTAWDASLFDLLSAYAQQRSTSTLSQVVIRRQPAWPLADARAALERLLGDLAEWTPLESLILQHLAPLQSQRSVLASAFSASLEMAKEGSVALRQEKPFAPLLLRAEKARPE
jgi:segregation and condensation protein A